MGNRLSRTDSSAGTTNYSDNAANMLTASTGTNASTYTPDADGDTLTGGGRTNVGDSQNRLGSCVSGDVRREHPGFSGTLLLLDITLEVP